MSRQKLLNYSRKNLLQIVITFTLIGTIIFWSMGGCSNNNGGGDSFPQPPEINSRNGVLKTTLETVMATNFVEDIETGEFIEVNTPTYNGDLVAPTFRIKPGDSIQFDLINNFPENPDDQRLGAFPKDPYTTNYHTTNYHTHGLTVDPGGISDNVFRRMQPGTTSPVQVDVHEDHQSGTFWYHPHKHGSASFSFFDGMAGFIIIEGGPGDLNEVPEIAAAKEVLMAFQVIRTDENGDVPFVNQDATQFSSDSDEAANGLWATYLNSNGYFVTNGVMNPTLRMRPGEVQRWRMLDAASGETLPIALEGHSLHILANDGINQAEMISLDVGEPYVMGAGNRVDLLVKAGEPGTYELQVLDPSGNYSISPQGI